MRAARLSRAGLLAALAGGGCGSAPPLPAPALPSPEVELPTGFVSETAAVNGTRVHCVHGGAGPAVLLLHGFPEDWYEYREVMPRLARRFTVVAVDLRGIGGSAAPPGGYDAATMAQDAYALARHLELDDVFVVGHDVGGMVAHAYARLHPEETRGALLLESPQAGLDPWAELTADPKLWHANFHQIPELPEKLLAGRQELYFEYFFKFAQGAISDEQAHHYASAYAAPAALHAAMEQYRAFPANERFNAEHQSPIAVPLMLAAGEHSFAPFLPRMADALRAHGWADVGTDTIRGAAHYVLDEQPELVAALIERCAAPAP